jgi:hypothetical protein
MSHSITEVGQDCILRPVSNRPLRAEQRASKSAEKSPLPTSPAEFLGISRYPACVDSSEHKKHRERTPALGLKTEDPHRIPAANLGAIGFRGEVERAID